MAATKKKNRQVSIYLSPRVIRWAERRAAEISARSKAGLKVSTSAVLREVIVREMESAK